MIDLDATLKQGSNTTAIWDRMLELEAIIEPLIMAADTWTLSSTPPLRLESSEMVVGQALRGIARIKLNRYAPFFRPTSESQISLDPYPSRMLKKRDSRVG